LLSNNDIGRNTSSDSEEDTPYVFASAMRKSVQEQTLHADAKAKTLADFKEARCQRAYYADREACLSVIMHNSLDGAMGDCEEEMATRRAAKRKSSGQDGRASARESQGPNYSSPARQSRLTNKRNQVSSPAAHYASGAQHSPGTALVVYFEPGGEADKELEDTFRQADSVIRTSSALAVDNETSAHVQTPATHSRLMARKQVGKGTPYVSQAPDDAMEEDKDSVENLSDYYNEELDINEGEESFGHDAHGTSPLADDCHRDK
jgi:hypothetical protein